MALYEKYAGLRDKYEIVAFHDSSVSSIAEMDEKLVEIKARFWNGKSLPFPTLVDKERKTTDEYGVWAFPTTVLIDPEGKIVPGNAAALLEEKLAAIQSAREGKGG